jgi:uncharacterized protein (DUF427 family)
MDDTAHPIESVWDYPRPPRIEAVRDRIRVVVDGVVVADSRRAVRVLETSHPPTYYVPREDVRTDLLSPGHGRTVCEWKGVATYHALTIGDRHIDDVAWSYEEPSQGFAAIAGHLAFYPGRVDEAWVGDERVTAQAGGFYGGWITPWLRGPFKGEPGTLGW